MAGNDPGRTLRHDEETTAPPEGMYWVQMQGLWALRPIADLDYTDEKPNSSQRTERSARSTLEQQRAPLTDADRQWLAQSAGASCSTAAASVDASAPTVGEGSSRPERLPRTQGVIEFHQQHCSPSFAAAVAHDGTPRVQPQPFTPPPPGPAPAAALLGGAQIGGQLGAQPSEGSPEQQSQEWPDWLLQWGWRVESGGGGPSDAPDSSAPPSAPPSPPETPQRSKSQTALARSPCGHPQQAVRPPTASGARACSGQLASGSEPRGEPSPLGCRSDAAAAALSASCRSNKRRLFRCAFGHPGSGGSAASCSTPSASGVRSCRGRGRSWRSRSPF